MYGDVVVGPTAEPQRSRADRSTDADTIHALRLHGERCVPGLRDARIVGSYAGLRPATEHRDYQISMVAMAVRDAPQAVVDSPTKDGTELGRNAAAGDAGWITVGGIRSTGLTCAPGIGEYVAELYLALRHRSPPVHASEIAAPEDTATLPADGCPVGVTRAATSPLPLEPPPHRCNDAVPPLAQLAAEYRMRGDGYVTLYGRPRRVTHPIASFGMEGLQ
jgi:hypothetical protein